MSDHDSYYCNYGNEINIGAEDVVEDYNSGNDVEEKNGDEFLIELYRERPFLYDKKNSNFKNILMKENAWKEISKIIVTNYGDIYTPQYCQKRCCSLREQYNREKKKIESQSKSGSAAPKSNSSKFSFYSQLSFLDQVIKRRRTYTNARSQASENQANVFVEKNLTKEIYDPDNISACSSNNKENSNENNKQDINIDNSQDIDNSHVLKGYPKLKRRKINETKEMEQTFYNLSNKICNYMETSQSCSQESTPDDLFIEFVKVQLYNIPQDEKNIRRKMIMDAICAPLPKM